MTNIETPSDTSANAGSHAFQADVARLLHMMVHSVYSERDIFLRELISNGADACEKLRYEAIARPELTVGDPSFVISVTLDPAGDTITVADNGVGMNRDDLVNALGTIASSGTRAFLNQTASQKADALEERESEGGAESEARLIGQFGIGFYSAFMVADRVDVLTRKAGEDQAWRWSSDGQSAYSLEPIAADQAPPRGTRVVLRLKESAADFKEPWRLEKIIREHSGAIGVPVDFREEPNSEAKRIADGTALWTKPKSAISEDDYQEFYRSISHQFDAPALTAHWRAEGRFEYTALAFVPGARPFDLFDPGRAGKARLYVRRVLISEDAELLPNWLRFVRLVVDSADLPLNVSREMIQHTPMFAAIKKAVTNRILQELVKLSDSDAERFAGVWENFGQVLKEGLYEDAERRDQLFKIARFTTTAGSSRRLADYVSSLRPNQTSIFYLTGDDAARIAASPQLEGFRARGIEVLLLSDPVDAFWVETAVGYDGKPFRSVTQGDAAIESVPLAEGEAATSNAETTPEVAALMAFMKQTLGDAVADVKASSRLSESPACLVAPAQGPDLRLRKILAQHGQAIDAPKPVLEINTSHPLLLALAGRLETDGERGFVEDASWLIHDEARLMDGEAPADAKSFAQRMFRVLQRAAT